MNCFTLSEQNRKGRTINDSITDKMDIPPNNHCHDEVLV